MTGYWIYIGDQAVPISVAGSVNTYRVTGLTPNTSYIGTMEGDAMVLPADSDSAFTIKLLESADLKIRKL